MLNPQNLEVHDTTLSPPKGDGGVGGLVKKIVFEIITRCIASNYTYTLHLHFHTSIKQSRIITDKFHFALCQKTKEQWYHANYQSVDYVHRQS